MTAQWQPVNVPLERRMIRDMDGVPLTDQDGHVIGASATGSFVHWMAPSLASAWIRNARTKIDAARAASSQPQVSWTAMRDTGYAIAQVYNALNIPWDIDIAARNLYRLNIAGRPSPAGGNSLAGEFGPTDYGEFNITNPYREQQGTGFGGVIPARGYEVFKQCSPDPAHAGDHPGQFLPTFGVTIDVATTYATPATVSLGLDSTPDFTILSSPAIQNFVYAQPPAGLGLCRLAYDCSSCDDPLQWDAYWFDWPAVMFGSPPLRFASAASDYYNWFLNWVIALETRTINQIVQDARSYQIYLNGRTLEYNGGSVTALLNRISANATQQIAPSPQTSRELQALGGLASALGTTLAVPTVGISMLVGGVVSGALNITSAFVPPDPSGLRLDDLGRVKPVFERPWLSGTPSDTSPGGAPTHTVPDPPGFVSGGSFAEQSRRLATTFGTGAANYAASLPPLTPLPSASSTGGAIDTSHATIPTIAWIAGGLVVAGGLTYGVYKITTRKTARTRRSSSR